MNAHQAKRVAMARRLEAESGRSVEDWVEAADESGVDGFMALVGWLEKEHGLGHFQARLVAEVHRDGRI